MLNKKSYLFYSWVLHLAITVCLQEIPYAGNIIERYLLYGVLLVQEQNCSLLATNASNIRKEVNIAVQKSVILCSDSIIPISTGKTVLRTNYLANKET